MRRKTQEGNGKRWQTWSSPICSVDNRIHKAESSHWHAHLGMTRVIENLCRERPTFYSECRQQTSRIDMCPPSGVGWNIQVPSSKFEVAGAKKGMREEDCLNNTILRSMCMAVTKSDCAFSLGGFSVRQSAPAAPPSAGDTLAWAGSKGNHKCFSRPSEPIQDMRRDKAGAFCYHTLNYGV